MRQMLLSVWLFLVEGKILHKSYVAKKYLCRFLQWCWVIWFYASSINVIIIITYIHSPWNESIFFRIQGLFFCCNISVVNRRKKNHFMWTKVQVQHNIQLVHSFVLLSSVPLIVQQDKKLILESMKIVITVAVSW